MHVSIWWRIFIFYSTFATAGEDFNSFHLHTTLQPGLSSWHFNLDILNNRVRGAEPTKHFGISLNLLTIIPNARLSNAQLNVTIIDDDSKKGRERERERESIIIVLAVLVCGQELGALVSFCPVIAKNHFQVIKCIVLLCPHKVQKLTIFYSLKNYCVQI